MEHNEDHLKAKHSNNWKFKTGFITRQTTPTTQVVLKRGRQEIVAFSIPQWPIAPELTERMQWATVGDTFNKFSQPKCDSFDSYTFATVLNDCTQHSLKIAGSFATVHYILPIMPCMHKNRGWRKLLISGKSYHSVEEQMLHARHADLHQYTEQSSIYRTNCGRNKAPMKQLAC